MAESHNLLHFDSDPPAPTAYAYSGVEEQAGVTKVYPPSSPQQQRSRISPPPASAPVATSMTASHHHSAASASASASVAANQAAAENNMQMELHVNMNANKTAENSAPALQFPVISMEPRSINFNADIKFDEDPFNVRLHGIMTPKEYTATAKRLNEALKACRSTGVDHALLLMGSSMITLVPWAMRSKANKKLRRSIMAQQVERFNDDNPHLVMRWQTKPTKCLLIMRQEDYVEHAAR